MRIGFTGTRALTEDDFGFVSEVIDVNAYDGTEFTSGACVGFDAFAAFCVLNEFPNAVHRLVVPANRSQVDTAIIEHFMHAATLDPERRKIEFMPDGTDYMDRNQRILDHTDRLLVVADYPEAHGKSRRSGTWATFRRARDRGIETRVLILNEGT